MFSLHSSLTAAYGAPVQREMWLVQIDLDNGPLRLCSYQNVTWNSYSWARADMGIDSIRVGAIEIHGSVVFGNADDAFGATFLTHNPTDCRIQIWGCDGSIDLTANPTAPKLLADGVCGGASFSEKAVTVPVRDACEYRASLRPIVSPQYGFNTVLPAGRVIVINNKSFVIKRVR